MSYIKRLFKEKNIHFIFDISLIFKGIFALFEIAGGILAYFISQQFLLRLVSLITRAELSEEPKDFIANYLVHSAQLFSINVRYFTAFYLLVHGIIKLWLIIGLFRKKLWYYPTAIIIFGLFIVYQIYLFVLTHSTWLLTITILDIIVIWLTWHEYRYMHRRLKRDAYAA